MATGFRKEGTANKRFAGIWKGKDSPWNMNSEEIIGIKR